MCIYFVSWPVLCCFCSIAPQKQGAWWVEAELFSPVVTEAVLVQLQVQDQTGSLASNQLKLVQLEKTEVDETD